MCDYCLKPKPAPPGRVQCVRCSNTTIDVYSRDGLEPLCEACFQETWKEAADDCVEVVAL